MSLILDSHRKYVSDAPRLSAFRRAIEEVVRPGDCVVDLGSGTGILGLMACRAGAARVYSIEADGIIGLARVIAAENGFGDRIQFLRGLSTRVDLPEKVDVVLSDQIGRLGFEAGIIQFFADAAARFLKPTGRLLPAAIEMWTAPVTSPASWRDCAFWQRESPADLKFTSASSIALNTGYPVTLSPEQLLASPVCSAKAELPAADSERWNGAASFEIAKAAEMHGIGGWFRARLSPGVFMTNSPLAADRINRRNVFLPIARPVKVSPGDKVTVKVRAVPAESHLSWTVVIESATSAGGRKVEKFSHSTLLGMMFSKEDLDRTNPSFVPKLTVWGEARHSVLKLIDGGRSLGEIEVEVLRRHPDIFSTKEQAAVFVAEVVTRYTL